MKLSVIQAVWQIFIQKVLSEMCNHRKHHLEIIDDCLVHSKKEDHLSLKNCKQFCSMISFLSVFLKDLQLNLAPIYQLTKKGIP